MEGTGGGFERLFEGAGFFGWGGLALKQTAAESHKDRLPTTSFQQNMLVVVSVIMMACTWYPEQPLFSVFFNGMMVRKSVRMTNGWEITKHPSI